MDGKAYKNAKHMSATQAKGQKATWESKYIYIYIYYIYISYIYYIYTIYIYIYITKYIQRINCL